ncbi:MAG: hypothetical protein ACE15D_08195 [Candidatus Eisenbacteria bacterium]
MPFRIQAVRASILPVLLGMLLVLVPSARPAGARGAAAGPVHATAPADLRRPDDPLALLWSGYLGGSLEEYGEGIVRREDGTILVAGSVRSPDLPTTPGAYAESLSGGWDVFVAALSAGGDSLLWCTYLGGAGVELLQTLACDPEGRPVLTGKTESDDFPTTPGAYDRTYGGGSDAFVAKLTAAGDALVFSTYLGGDGYEIAFGLLDDPIVGLVVAGYTQSPLFPTTPGAYDPSYNGGFDIFVTKLSGDGGAILWSTLLGGWSDDRVYDLDRDGMGNLLLTSWTQSPDFPTTRGAFDETYNGAGDAYAAKLSSGGNDLLWSTFLGGAELERAYGIVAMQDGGAVVAGLARSPDFPLGGGGYDTQLDGPGDGFVLRLDATAASVLWGTFLGGAGDDACADLAIDVEGRPVVTGTTDSADFPTTAGAFDRELGGTGDGFATVVDATGGGLAWSSFVGGGGQERAKALALTGPAEISIAGDTESSDFPAGSACFDSSYAGMVDAFVCGLRIRQPAAAGDGTEDGAQALPAGVAIRLVNPLHPPAKIVVDGGPVAAGVVAAAPGAPVAQLTIHDPSGRRVRLLFPAPALGADGASAALWDGCDEAGRRAPPGVYFVRAIDARGCAVARRTIVLLDR